MTFHSFRFPLLALIVTCPAAALAQQPQVSSQLNIRPVNATADLNGALARLGANPRDVPALIAAGEAALALDDPRAATGFFARADEIESGNGRIKAGLGRAMLELQNPNEALRLFDQATRLGQPDRAFLSDRGLARDLTGDTAGAQRDYQAALRAAPDDAEIIRRYAVSLGISGQIAAADKLIEPLLYKSDRAAWRNRAFVYAMNGRQKEARDITRKVMPQPLAEQIQPYMDRMPGLTPAQRAAAVHFGSFPSEGLRMAAAPVVSAPVAAPAPSRPVAGSRADTLPPAATKAVAGDDSATAQLPAARRIGERINTRIGDTPTQIAQKQAAAAEAQRQTNAAATVRPQIRMQPPTQVASAPARAEPIPQPPAPQPPAHPPVSATPSQGQGLPPEPTPIQQAPVVSVATVPAAAVPLPAAAPPAPNPEATRTLADIIRELQVPEEEKQIRVAAVDLSEIAALQEKRHLAKQALADKAKKEAVAKAKAEADARAKAQAAEKARLARNPSRAWVQVGTGQNISALGFTMKGLRRKYDALSTRDAWTASWGRTNRLVVGPFASFAKARTFEARLKQDGADAFSWQSDAGEEVTAIAGQ